jgi:hypothetical protein
MSAGQPAGNDLLVHIENKWPKLGAYLRNYVVPAIQSRGLPGQVLATPTDKPGPVQLQNLTDIAPPNGVQQIVPGANIAVSPTDGKGVVTVSSTSGGTVSSVGLTVPAWQSVAGSPVTGAGTLAITDNTQPANEVFAGPATGSPAAPAFRALVAADIPSVPPSGAAGGDLSGTYPNPTVHQVNAGAVPISASLLGTNGSGQLIAASIPASTAFRWSTIFAGG